MRQIADASDRNMKLRAGFLNPQSYVWRVLCPCLFKIGENHYVAVEFCTDEPTPLRNIGP
ncbi:hypothetical protein GGE07_005478 [Sinorhizobium terangae]|nr:hypothetical protein [Sinorhizobium terangae]